MITFDEYQTLARSTAIYPYAAGGNLLYPALGLAGEAGEVCDKVKKLVRDHGILSDNAGTDGRITHALTPEQTAPLAKELGDVLWYVAAMASELNLSLNAIAEANYAKLKARQQANTLQGSGDDR